VSANPEQPAVRPGVLTGLRVVELAVGVAGPYCAKLLGDLGADVIKIETPEGDNARRMGPFAGQRVGPERSVLFLHLNTSKRSRCLDMASREGVEAFSDLAADAEAVVTDWTGEALSDAGIGSDALLSANERLVLLSLTPFGASGPYRDYRTEPLTTFHGAGEGYLTPVASHLMPEVVGRPPLRQGRFAGEYKLATYAATLLLAGVYHARATGHGQTIDLSKQDALLGLNFFEFASYLSSGAVPTRASLAVPFGGIMPCADGYLQFTFHEEHQWRALMKMMGDPGWAGEEWNRTPEARLEHAGEINERLMEWLQERTRDEIVKAGQQQGVTVAAYRGLAEVLGSEQMAVRHFFQLVDHPVVGEHLYPTAPWRYDGDPLRPGRAPLLGEHPAARFDRPLVEARRPGAGDPGKGPLSGLRVADFTWAVAGPTASMILASLGAEVIKVETTLRLDVIRRNPALNATTNRLKKAVTLNLRHPRAVELAKRLVAVSDVVTESFRPGVMAGLGLGYADLRSVKENIVMFSGSMAGQHGPQAQFAGYAPMFVALSGLGEMTGYADGPPTQIRVGGDIIVGVHGGFALLAALVHRQATGEGTYVDMSAVEAQSCLIGDSLLDFAVNGTVPWRSGNDEPGMAPHNCYRCSGDDEWVSIAVTGDDDWVAFAKAIGSPAWTEAPRFADAQGRFAHRVDLDRNVSAWTEARTPQDVTRILQAAGVAAMPSYRAPELFADPHVRDRGMVVRAPGAGGDWTVVRLGGAFSVTPLRADRAGPAMGEHNQQVFGRLLGLPQDEIDDLTDEGVFA
jgi:crotonobetainyl-CoA:carnitine CoA-transferase CaiB-like acyl-CoA transferase